SKEGLPMFRIAPVVLVAFVLAVGGAAAQQKKAYEAVVSGRVEKYDAETKTLHVRRLGDGELFKLNWGPKPKALVDSLPVEPTEFRKGDRILAWHWSDDKIVTIAHVYINNPVPKLKK